MDKDWVIKRLKKLGKRQADLARAVQVARPRINETLNGKRSLSAAEFLGWSDFLEVPVEDLRKRLGIDKQKAA